MEKNNGFTTNDWQEKLVLIYLVDFVQFLHSTNNFVYGAFEHSPIWDKICKINDCGEPSFC